MVCFETVSSFHKAEVHAAFNALIVCAVLNFLLVHHLYPFLTPAFSMVCLGPHVCPYFDLLLLVTIEEGGMLLSRLEKLPINVRAIILLKVLESIVGGSAFSLQSFV